MKIVQHRDIDLHGIENADGSPKEYVGIQAIKNALYVFLSSKTGDYLMSPQSGGILDRMVFKTMTPDFLENIKTILKVELEEHFPMISMENVLITPDHLNRFVQITVYYSIPSEGIMNDSVDVFYNAEYSTNSFTYEDIDYKGDQLLDFMKLKKPEFSNSKLVFDYDGGFWKWGKYKFTNLLPNTDEFEDLIILANM